MESVVESAIQGYYALIEGELMRQISAYGFDSVQEIAIEQSVPQGIIDRRWIVMKDGRKIGCEMRWEGLSVVSAVQSSRESA